MEKNNSLQKTLKKEIRIEGIGIHTGEKFSISLIPSPPNSGISIKYNDLSFPASLQYVVETRNSITLGYKNVKLKTVEHLFATFFSLGITNVVIRLDRPVVEVPILDGSAKHFVELIKEAGIEIQNVYVNEKQFAPYLYTEKDRFVAYYPYEKLILNYTIDFPEPIGVQTIFFEVEENSFVEGISPARTFGYIEDARIYKFLGLAKGASLENTLVASKKEKKYLIEKRFPDEEVRHKVIDFLGALALCPIRPIGLFIIRKSGHRIDVEFLKKLIQI